MQDTRTETDDLNRIDRGEYAGVVEAYRAGAIDVAAPVGALVAAEVALYLDDTDRAAGRASMLDSAEWLDSADERGEWARRARLIVACARYQSGDYVAADEGARAVIEGARVADDPMALLRARFLLARCAFRRSALLLARERFAAVADEASALGNGYYRAQAFYFLASSAMQSDDFATADGYWPAALAGLAPEGGRAYAHALNAHGWQLSEAGDDAAALREFSAARGIFDRLGLVGGLLDTDGNAARSLVMLGRASEAVERFGHLIPSARWRGNPSEGTALYWLAVALHDLGRYGEAVDAAAARLTLAELVGDDGDIAAARIVGARAALALGPAPDALANLERYAVSEEVSGYLRAQAVLYLAEALAGSDPTRAATLCAQAHALPVVASSARLLADLSTVERKLARQAVRVAGREFVINPDLGALNVDDVVAQVKRFLFEDALTREGGNVERAGERIGLSKSAAYRTKDAAKTPKR